MEVCDLGMHFEVIALCDMMITDRLEALCQYLLKDELQFETMSSNQALSALEVAIKDNRPDLKVKGMEEVTEIRGFFTAETGLHSFILIMNAHQMLL